MVPIDNGAEQAKEVTRKIATSFCLLIDGVEVGKRFTQKVQVISYGHFRPSCTAILLDHSNAPHKLLPTTQFLLKDFADIRCQSLRSLNTNS